MYLLCKVCDSEILENESEYNNYLATLRKRNDKCLYKKYTINIVSLDEFDNILNLYTSHHNKKFDLHSNKLTFSSEFFNNFKQSVETTYQLNVDDISKKEDSFIRSF